MTSNATVEFLHSMQSKLQWFQNISQIYEPQMANRFNAIDLLSPGENGLSRIFAELLDPAGRHSQGVAFLECFIEHFREKLKIDKTWASFDQAQTRVEASTDENRRVDITITLEVGQRWAIGIENKPWAGDQQNQVADYIRHLKKHYPERHRLVYLSGNGDGPSGWSTGDGNFGDTLVVIGYREVIEWLADCIRVCRASKIRFFLEELQLYILKNFDGVDEVNERKMIVEESCKSESSIKAAIEIGMALGDIQARLLKKLWADIEEKISQQHPEWNFVRPSFEYARESKWKPIRVFFSQEHQYAATLEFGQHHCNDCYFGIRKERTDLDELSEVKNIFGGRKSDWWIFYKTFEYRNWGYHSSTWADIHTGKMADRIFSQFKDIHQTLEAHQKLHLLQGDASRA